MPNAETGELPTLAEGATCLSHTSVGSDPKVIPPQALCILGVTLLGSRTFLFLLSTRSQMLVATLADVLPHCWGDGPHQVLHIAGEMVPIRLLGFSPFLSVVCSDMFYFTLLM